MRLWRPGWAGAARLGLAHGAYCLGCCALLMCLLFVICVAALALFVSIEKLLPAGARIGVAVGFVAIIVGFVMLLNLRWPA